MVKKIIPLSAVCLALMFASCGSSNDASKSSTDSTTNTEVSATDENTNAASADNIPGLDSLKASNSISLTGNDQMHYSETLLKVKAGEEITLSMKNIGKIPAEAMSHDVVVLKPGSSVPDYGNAAGKSKDELPAALSDQVIAHTKMLGPGQSDKITFTLSAPGVYPFLCTFPGHWMTMRGKIVAE